MNDIDKRRFLFILGCIPSRLFIVYLAKTLNPEYLNYLALCLCIPMIGFLYIYLTNSRKTGIETFGARIWWNQLRIVHFLLYLLFMFFVLTNKKHAYLPLLFDVIIGFIAFVHHHYYLKP